ncbi:uncharacterized protein N7515_006052 [Penicillium bovifimosum]|uniref:Uncharacterized protein n=1 Tax=Penicillium bovifimosum TaxID=126998 RepID=A0A9W9GUB9_9EURO|nr:uncharacterized protein N7515_006052 [Penicillium bovifimosum]KAJ5130013.1 hypothetical protein N7515_006052 [Penicillium bovifimosum]
MEDRASIIWQIRGVMRDFLDSYPSSTPIPPIRIAGDTPNSILDQSEFMASIEPIVAEVRSAVATWRPDTVTRWVAASKYEGRTSFFFLDLNNVDYDYDTAHKCLTKVPVYILSLSKAPRIFRFCLEDQAVAEWLAKMHDLHAGKPLPLLDDRTKPRVLTLPVIDTPDIS